MRSFWIAPIALGCLLSMILISGIQKSQATTADRHCKVISLGTPSRVKHPSRIISHQRGRNWLEPGYLLADIGLGRMQQGADDNDSPVIASVLACKIITPSGKVSLEPARNLNWANARWLAIGAAKPWINSHQREPVWLPDGYFITQIDLDSRIAGISISSWDAPIIGAVRIANVPGYRWGDCHWETPMAHGLTGIPNSEGGERYWREDNRAVTNGYYITQIDLDALASPERGDIDYVPGESPAIGGFRVCSLEAE
jgi:hypothetical protein